MWVTKYCNKNNYKNYEIFVFLLIKLGPYVIGARGPVHKLDDTRPEMMCYFKNKK